MPHFYVSKDEIYNDYIELTQKETLQHIKNSLRVKINEIVKFIDEDENVYKTSIIQIEKDFIKAKIISKNKSDKKLNFNLYLAISILKPDAMNLAISNATQCGVFGVYPFVSDNTVFKNKQNIEKWQKISDESFKQCERANKMKVFEVLKLDEIIQKFSQVIVFTEKEANIKLNDVVKNFECKKDTLLIIGPEGGFTEREFDYFNKLNLHQVSLGKLIYKAPNAVVAGVNQYIYEVSRG